MPSLFGDLVHGGEVEDAVKEALQRWMPTYLTRVSEIVDETLPPIRSTGLVSDFDRWPQEQLPGLVITSTGLLDEPTKDGEGYYRGRFGVEVAAIVTGKDVLSTRRRAQHYALAVRGALMQRRSLQAGMRATDWLGEDYGRLDVDVRRTLIAGSGLYAVEVDHLLSIHQGPVDPDPDPPYTEWPTVSEVIVEVEPKES